MHVAGGNGNLIHVAVAARVLPRHWDGRRLLRFLAGLAMLALAFTARVEATAPAAVPAPSSAVAVRSAAAEPSEADPGAPVPVERPRPAVPVTAPPAVLAAVLILVGLALPARGGRAPPAFG